MVKRGGRRERKRERERERQRERDRDRETDRQRQGERQRHRERDAPTHKHRKNENKLVGPRQRETTGLITSQLALLPVVCFCLYLCTQELFKQKTLCCKTVLYLSLIHI